MPFSQPLRHTSPYLWPAEVSRRAYGAWNVFVEKTVVKSSEEWRRKAVASKKGMRAGFLYKATD